MVHCLPSMHEASGSVPSTTKQTKHLGPKLGMVEHPVILTLAKWKQGTRYSKVTSATEAEWPRIHKTLLRKRVMTRTRGSVETATDITQNRHFLSRKSSRYLQLLFMKYVSI